MYVFSAFFPLKTFSVLNSIRSSLAPYRFYQMAIQLVSRKIGQPSHIV